VTWERFLQHVEYGAYWFAGVSFIGLVVVRLGRWLLGW